jgi:hypothetical protein
LSLWARLPLPVAAIIESGGRSVHAWVMVNCANAAEYRAKVQRTYSLLSRFGICLSNKNASRLSRLPGAQREIGGTEMVRSGFCILMMNQAKRRSLKGMTDGRHLA